MMTALLIAATLLVFVVVVGYLIFSDAYPQHKATAEPAPKPESAKPRFRVRDEQVEHDKYEFEITWHHGGTSRYYRYVMEHVSQPLFTGSSNPAKLEALVTLHTVNGEKEVTVNTHHAREIRLVDVVVGEREPRIYEYIDYCDTFRHWRSSMPYRHSLDCLPDWLAVEVKDDGSMKIVCDHEGWYEARFKEVDDG